MVVVMCLFLSVLLLVSAVAKSAQLRESRGAAIELGVPGPVALPVVVALIMVEGALAIMLLTPAYRVGGFGTVGLMMALTAVVVANLGKDRHPACRCFGSFSTRPLSMRHVVRNLLIAGVAGLATVVPASDGPSITTLVIALLVLTVAALAFALYAVLRQHRRLLDRIRVLEGSTGPPPLNDLALPWRPPHTVLPDVDGMSWSLDRLARPPAGAALLFVDPDCVTCHDALPRFLSLASDRRWALVSPRVHRWTGLPPDAKTLVDVEATLANSLGVTVVPCLALLDQDGVIRQPPALGPDAIVELIRTDAGATRRTVPSSS